jgi:hypothetical protein
VGDIDFKVISVGDIDFKVISVAENWNIFQKNQILEGKISWRRGNTWRLTIHFKHEFLLFLAVQKIDTYTWQNNVHLLSGGVGTIFFKCVLPSLSFRVWSV